MQSDASPGAAWPPCCCASSRSRPLPRADTAVPPDVSAKALEMLKRSVGFKTVEGEGQVPAYAEYLAGELQAHGFAAEDIKITPLGETATLVARYRGHRPDAEADPHRLAHGRRGGEARGLGARSVHGRGRERLRVRPRRLRQQVRARHVDRRRSSGSSRKASSRRRDILIVLSGDEETSHGRRPPRSRRS